IVEKAAMTFDPRETSTAAGSATGQPADLLCQLDVPLRHPARIMGGQAEVDPVPDTREFRMMIDLLGVQSDARHECERFAEILEPEAPLKRLTVGAHRPAIRDFHG